MNIKHDDVRARPKFTEQQIKDWRAYEKDVVVVEYVFSASTGCHWFTINSFVGEF